jgi:hypothetical protein
MVILFKFIKSAERQIFIYAVNIVSSDIDGFYIVKK